MSERKPKKNRIVDVDPATKLKNKKQLILNILPNEIKLDCKTENQKKFKNTIKDPSVKYVIASGIAGAGKTYLSLVCALNLLRDETNTFTKITIFKSVKGLEGEDIGFLPGNVDEKLKYVLASYTIQLEKILPVEIINKLLQEQIIEIFPITNLRGTSLNGVVIIDEFQNVSVKNAETIMTRMENDSKCIIIGDVRQIDAKNKKDNGLKMVVERFENVNPAIEIITFTENDSVRNELIKLITKIFEDYECENAK